MVGEAEGGLSCEALTPDVDGPVHPYFGASAGCWAVYGEVLAKEYGEFRYPSVHRLTVDVYSAQHPGTPSRRAIQSVAVHLVSLDFVLEQGFSSEKATAGIRRVSEHRKRFVWLDPPSPIGSLTILDVRDAKDFTQHEVTVKRWAESVWQAWSPHHDTILKAVRQGDNIELDFPLKPEEPAQTPAGLLDALSVSAQYVGKNQFDYLVEVESEGTLRRLAPDFKRLAALPVRGIIVTSRSVDSRFDFVSRFFAPDAGIDEDPVTGSAHCCLGDFWRKRLNKTEFVAFQASARGGVVKVRVTKDRGFSGRQGDHGGEGRVAGRGG